MPRTSPRAPAALVTLFAASGCHEVVALPAPDLTDAQSILLIWSPHVGEVEAVAADVQAGLPGLVLGEAEAVHALTFACPVARLGLEAGRQDLLELPGDEVLLPEPVRALSWQSGQGEWRASEAELPLVQDVLHRLPLTPERRCVARQAELVRVDTALPNDGHREAALAIHLPDDTALVASREGFFYRVRPSGRVETLPRLIEGVPLAAHAQDDGTVWLLNDGGQLTRGPLEGPRELVAERPGLFGRNMIAELTGPTDPALPLELFVATTSKTVARFAEGTWTVFGRARPSMFSVPRVLWRGPARAAALGFGDGGELLEYEQGRTNVTDLGQDPAVGLTETEALGLVLGTRRGQVLIRQGGAFTPLASSVFQSYALVLQPLPEGALLVGGLEGRFGFDYGLAQWLPGLGFCPPLDLDGIGVVSARVDDRTFLFLTVTNLNPDQAFNIALMRLETLPARCQPPSR